MLLVNIDRSLKEPLFLQIYEEIKKKIDNDILSPGDKLPSTRELSQQLVLNRTTVYKAYEELWASGYIESKPGSYSIVRKPATLATKTTNFEGKNINWDSHIVSRSKTLLYHVKKQDYIKPKGRYINFRSLSPDPDLMPTEEFRKCMNNIIKSKGNSLLQYGDPMGYKPLRKFLSKRMSLHGIHINEDELMLTGGIQNGLELILKLFVQPGTTIFVEKPTYSAVLPLFNYYNANIISIPVNNDGIDLKRLESEFQKHQPAFLYTIPNFHNPLGINTSQKHREKLLELAKQYEVPVLEDGFEEEMKYFGKSVLPIKSMDRNGLVIYLGTFSKILFPGLRVGWIAGDNQLIQKLSAIKKASDISGNIMDQAALEEFCQQGFFERHVKRMHRIYRKRMQTALKACKAYLPHRLCDYTKPQGGYTLWIELKNHAIQEDYLIEALIKNHVVVTPGHLFYQEKSEKAAFRISIAHCKILEIEEGIKQISQVIKSLKEN